MEIQEWFESYQDGLRKEGRSEGRTLALARLFARRLGRPLAEAERQVLADRLARLGEDRLDEIILGFGPEALTTWLADPAAT